MLTLAMPLARVESPPESWEEWRVLGDGIIAVRTAVTASSGTRGGKVTLARLDKELAPTGEVITLYDGPAASTALGVCDGAAAVVLFRGGAQPVVKVAVIDLATRVVRTVDLDRTTGADYSPSAVVVCGGAEGFTVLWQEHMQGNPKAEVRSTLARIKADGTLIAKPSAVPIPWSLGAIVDDGRGYTPAVNFDGPRPDKTRVCFVTLTREGKPEQHPWWGSRPSVVEEVQLMRAAGKVTAVFRGAGTLLSVDADKSAGQWGRRPSRAAP